MLRILCMSAMLSLSLACSATAAPLSSVAAVVNGEMITTRELERAMEPDLRANGIDPNNPANAPAIGYMRTQVLQEMINEKILNQEAARQGIQVADALVDEEIGRVMAQSQLSPDEFRRQLALQGISEDLLRSRLRSNITSQMLIGRMVFNKVVVTQDEINAYYREHGGEIPMGRMRVALIIYPAGEDAQAWARRIASGEMSFDDVARRVSVGPNPQGGGDMGDMDMEDLADPLQMALSTMRPGDISEVVNMGISAAQIRLMSVENSGTPASVPHTGTPDPETAARIEDILRRPRLEARFEEYTEQLRNKAIVDIRL